MDRVYNIEKSRKRKASDSGQDLPKKRGRPKSVINLESRYPTVCPEEIGSSDSHFVEALSKEMEKENPRKDVILQLMKSTFYSRRRYILQSESSVTCKLEKFPALKMPPVVR